MTLFVCGFFAGLGVAAIIFRSVVDEHRVEVAVHKAVIRRLMESIENRNTSRDLIERN